MDTSQQNSSFVKPMSLPRSRGGLLVSDSQTRTPNQGSKQTPMSNQNLPIESDGLIAPNGDNDMSSIASISGEPRPSTTTNTTTNPVRNPSSISQRESRRKSIQRCIQCLVHACECSDANCRLPSCHKMKRVIQHVKNCKRRNHGQGVTGCAVCKQLIALCCYHSKQCTVAKCPVPYCLNIKHKLKQKTLQQRLQQAQILKQRIASMCITK